jgi:hypothetical protein
MLNTANHQGSTNQKHHAISHCNKILTTKRKQLSNKHWWGHGESKTHPYSVGGSTTTKENSTSIA